MSHEKTIYRIPPSSYRIYIAPRSCAEKEGQYEYFDLLSEMTAEGDWLRDNGYAFTEEMLCQAGLGHGWQSVTAQGECIACAGGQASSGIVCPTCGKFNAYHAALQYCTACGRELEF